MVFGSLCFQGLWCAVNPTKFVGFVNSCKTGGIQVFRVGGDPVEPVIRPGGDPVCLTIGGEVSAAIFDHVTV